MATMNPLEKKARSSFIKGLVIAGLIGLIGIAVLAFFIFKMNGEEKQRIEAMKRVLIITTDVKSGDEVTVDLLKTESANAEVASSGALTMGDFDELSQIVDEAGNLIAIKVYAKIDIPARTILTSDMLSTEEETVTDDLREKEYNMIVLPSSLEDGETIDIRFRLPSGEDYIVLPKKKVKLADLGGTFSSQTIVLNVTEDQMLVMSSAIVDAYQIGGSYLYATKYTDPGLQAVATPTYVPSYETIQLISTDPNIVDVARNTLVSRYNSTYNSYRSAVSNAINGTDENTRSGLIESGTNEEIATQQSERRTYLESMYGME